MIIYNCSFIVPSAKGDDFISWMQSGRMLALAASPDSDSNPLDLRLTRLRAVVGDPDALREASTFPLEARFATLSAARRWADTALAALLREYEARYGRGQALSISTILETL